jgi:hypothetical protein
MAAICKEFCWKFESKNICWLLCSALTLKPTLKLRANGVFKNVFWLQNSEHVSGVCKQNDRDHENSRHGTDRYSAMV